MTLTDPSDLHKIETHFSWLRTRLSVERTLMSWVRTATALIGFGFTIFQFFEKMRDMKGVAPARDPQGIRLMSISMIAIGTVSLITASLEYRRTLKYLWGDEFRIVAGVGDRPAWTPVFTVAILLAMVGVVTFGAVARRTALE